MIDIKTLYGLTEDHAEYLINCVNSPDKNFIYLFKGEFNDAILIGNNKFSIISEKAKLFDEIFPQLSKKIDISLLIISQEMQKKAKTKEILKWPVEKLNIEDKAIKTRFLNVCKGDHIYTIGDLVKLPLKEMLKIPNFGKTSLFYVISELAKLNLSFDYNGDI